MVYILLTESQANLVRGKYGKYSELNPIKVVEGYVLPLDILDDLEFASVHDFLKTLPQQEVTFLPEPEIE
jgi:hypothetical protein